MNYIPYQTIYAHSPFHSLSLLLYQSHPDTYPANCSSSLCQHFYYPYCSSTLNTYWSFSLCPQPVSFIKLYHSMWPIRWSLMVCFFHDMHFTVCFNWQHKSTVILLIVYFLLLFLLLITPPPPETHSLHLKNCFLLCLF